MLKYRLVQLRPRPRQRALFSVLRILVHRPSGVQPSSRVLVRLQIRLGKQRVDRVPVRRHPHDSVPPPPVFVLPVLALDRRLHSVFVRRPLAESIHVFPHPRVLRVKQVHAVLRHPEPLRVHEVVAVPADVIALVHEKRLHPELSRRAAREDAARDAGADDDEVELAVANPRVARDAGEPARIVVVAATDGDVHARPLVGVGARGHGDATRRGVRRIGRTSARDDRSATTAASRATSSDGARASARRRRRVGARLSRRRASRRDTATA